MSDIEKIARLRRSADAFASFHDHYEKTYRHDSHCDKKGYGSGQDNRFSAFKINTSFDSWRGYYGNSGCSNIFSVPYPDLVAPYIIKALNAHQRELFATVAKLMREAAAELTSKAEAELAAQRQLLDDAKAGVA